MDAKELFAAVNNNVKKNVTRQAKCKANSVAFDAIVMNVSPQVNGGPINFSVVPVENVSVPYVFRKAKEGGTPKIVDKPVEGATNLEFKAGDASFFVTLFPTNGAPITLPVSGGLHRVHGLFYDYYKKKVEDPLMISFTCAMISRPLPMNIPALMATIPFANRSINLARDLPNGDFETYAKDNTWRFIHVKVSPTPPEVCEKGQIYGKFTPQPKGEPPVLMCKPKDKPEIIALTGGRSGEFVAENQFVLVQQPEDGGEAFAIVGLTKVYEDSLEKLQCSWLQMGGSLVPRMHGDAFCLIDRDRTQRFSVNDSSMAGTISLATIFVPDCAAIARSAGYKVSWESATKLVPALASGNTWKMGAMNYDFTYANAINLARFYGDVSCLKRAMELGFVELYAFTNRVFVSDEAYAKFLALTEDAKVEKSMDTDVHPPTGIETAIFAMVTPASKCPIVDYVAVIGRPRAMALLTPAAESKKAKVEEAPVAAPAVVVNKK